MIQIASDELRNAIEENSAGKMYSVHGTALITLAWDFNANLQKKKCKLKYIIQQIKRTIFWDIRYVFLPSAHFNNAIFMSFCYDVYLR